MASVLDPEFYLKTLKDINKSLDKLKCFVEECCKKIPENIGNGIGIYRRLHNNKWEFKSLVAGANTTISETFDEITISSTGGGGSFNCNDLNSCSTDSLPEGLSNLYYTDGRVLSYVSTLPISTFSNDIPYLSIVSVDGITITGDGTPANPLIASGSSPIYTNTYIPFGDGITAGGITDSNIYYTLNGDTGGEFYTSGTLGLKTSSISTTQVSGAQVNLTANQIGVSSHNLRLDGSNDMFHIVGAVNKGIYYAGTSSAGLSGSEQGLGIDVLNQKFTLGNPSTSLLTLNSTQFKLSSAVTELVMPLNGQTNGYVLTTNGTKADWQPKTTGTVTSVGLSTSSNAFTITNSPITSSGNITIDGAGTSSQYIRGDGSLATFPDSSGGGGGVVYYFNGSVASSIGGDYQMNMAPNTGAAANFTKVGDGLIVTFATDASDPNATNIPGGVWVFHSYLSMSANGGSPEINAVIKIFDGAIYTTIATGSPYLVSNGTNTDLYTFGVPIPQTTIAATDRVIVEFYLSNSLGKTITFYTQDARLNSVSTTLPTGISILNGLTASTQFFANDTNVTISSSGATHTLGWIGTLADGRIASSTNWNTAYTNRITSLTTTGTSGASTLIANTLNIPQYTDQYTGTVTSVAALTLGTTGTDLSSTVANSTTTPVITLNVPTASASNRGVLSSTDWSTFNNKQAALTNPITGTGTTNEIAYFSGTSALSSLTTATYPSLTELSYVKGATSSLQTQIDNISGGYDTQFAMYQDIGSACVAGTYGATFDRMSASVAGGALATGQAIFMLIRFTKADTILGLKWFQGTQGNYTANNYNGVFLATLSAGTLTVVASSTTDGNIWKGTSNSLQSKAFSAGYAVSANTTYVVGAVYSSSAQVTLPTIYGVASTATTAQGAADFANSVKLYAFKSAVTAVPTTQAYSGLTGSNILPVFFAYK